MDEDGEARIRAKAYEIWERADRPASQQDRHWNEAKALIETEEGMAESRRPANAGADPLIEPAIAFQNQADLPDLTDQGESPPVPDRSATPTISAAPNPPAEAISAQRRRTKAS